MCGFVGLIGDNPVAHELGVALCAIQHRGQDAAGAAVLDVDGMVRVHKDLGLVTQVLTQSVLDRALPGRVGIGHVRYPTAGSGGREDAQPFAIRRPSMALAHNGNVINVPEVEAHLRERGMKLTSACDAEPIMCVLADELGVRQLAHQTTADVVHAVGQVLERVRGSYSVVCALEVDDRETLVAFRDPHGIRPAVYGRRADGAWMVASESVALDVLDFVFVGHIPAGYVALFRANQEPVLLPVRPESRRPCVFEGVYFARPDSRTETGRVLDFRARLGRRLADAWTHKGLPIDVVVAVPDTSRPAADAMAIALGVRSEEGFIKNRYSGRTFIMPNDAVRQAALRLKLNPIDEVFRDRHVVLVDDSVVRGNTMRKIIGMVRRHDPKSLHVAIFSPAVRHPCFYGIDMPSRDELVAGRIAPEQVEAQLAVQLGADSLTFLSEAALVEEAGTAVCAACFNGEYVVPLADHERTWILRDRRPNTTNAPSRDTLSHQE